MGGSDECVCPEMDWPPGQGIFSVLCVLEIDTSRDIVEQVQTGTINQVSK